MFSFHIVAQNPCLDIKFGPVGVAHMSEMGLGGPPERRKSLELYQLKAVIFHFRYCV